MSPSAVTEAGGETVGADDATAVLAMADAEPFDAVVEAMVDAACSLPNIPSSCPNCMTQNASDVPICQMYLTCFIQKRCKPSTPCGSNDGVCGVNTIGGGEAPFQAAVQTYDCACP